MLPTPRTDHLNQSLYESVYPPSVQEDTFLLLDALEMDVRNVTLKEPLILEIGVGSGCVSSFVSNLIPNSISLGTDLLFSALSATRETFIRNNDGSSPVLIQTSFIQSIRRGIVFDILICNPPYVPTPEEECLSSTNTQSPNGYYLRTAWAGGQQGRQMIDYVLDHLNSWLHPHHGRAYIVALEANQPDEMISRVETNSKLKGQRLLTRQCGCEKLTILLFTR